MIYCHSPGGDTAAALSHTAFYVTYIPSLQGDNATVLAEFDSLRAVVISVTEVYWNHQKTTFR